MSLWTDDYGSGTKTFYYKSYGSFPASWDVTRPYIVYVYYRSGYPYGYGDGAYVSVGNC